jgi:pimeloyl-ACP methyl ester carboxylesterase
VYEDLEQPGAIHRQVTPTLRLSYVTPPINGTTTWNDPDLQQQELLPPELQPDESKPVAVYIPGLDGYGLSAHRHQFDDLANNFEFWRLTVLPEDRSSLQDVVKAISGFVLEEFDGGRPVTLIGESAGGLLASAVALKLQEKDVLQGLVLVNPATSYDQTAWESIVPILTWALPYLDRNRSSATRDQRRPVTTYGVL